jgi:hypothetical protein
MRFGNGFLWRRKNEHHRRRHNRNRGTGMDYRIGEFDFMRNRIKCRKCGDIIESKNRHDYVTCKCGAVAVDGGSSYLKRTGDPADIEELEEWPKDPKDMYGNE